jgi:hypothetical protein
MNRFRLLRILVGLVLWGLVLGPAAWILSRSDQREGQTFAALLQHLAQQDSHYLVEFPRPIHMDLGTSVVVTHPSVPQGAAQQDGEVVGEVDALLDENGVALATLYGRAHGARIRIYDRARTQIYSDARTRLIQVPRTFQWVVETLLTDEAMVHLAYEWNLAMYQHRDRFFALLAPALRELIADVEDLVATELPAFTGRHRDKAEALTRKLEAEIAGEEIVDLFQQEIWPIAERRLAPTLERIGADIWRKFPLWSLSWRYAYERLPLTGDEKLQTAWASFVESQVVPTITEHSDELLGSAKELVRESLANPRVAAHIRTGFNKVLASREFQDFAEQFVKEAVLDNPRFHELIRGQWNSPRVQRAVAEAGTHLEPTIRRMGDYVLGTRKDGITQEFARVLRAQILLKDHHRILIHPGIAKSEIAPPGHAFTATLEWETSE